MKNAAQTFHDKFNSAFPYFIEKDYCEPDWVEFYQYLKDAKIATIAHDGGFYFRTLEDYQLAILLK